MRGFTPFQIPLYQSQFLWGDNLLEQDDPTPEQEEDYRQSLIKPVSEEMEEEENEEEAEEEESDWEEIRDGGEVLNKWDG